MTTPATCKSCRKPIRWVRMNGTRSMPVDALPAADGNVLVLADGKARVLRADERGRYEGTLYKSHFATCPHAAQLRRRR